MSDFSAKIQAILDLSKIPSQIAEIEKSKVTLKHFALDTSGLPSEIQGSLDKHKFKIVLDGIKDSDLESSMKRAGAKAGKTLNKYINDRLDNGSIYANITAVTERYKQFANTGHNALEKIGKDIIALNSIQESFKRGLSEKGQFDAYREYIETISRVKNALLSLAKQSRKSDRVSVPLDSGAVKASIDSVTKQYESLKSSAHSLYSEVGDKLRQLSALQGKLATNVGTDAWVQAGKEYSALLKDIQDDLATISKETPKLENIEKLKNSGQILKSIESLSGQYGKIADSGHAVFSTIASDLAELRRLESELHTTTGSSELIKKYDNLVEVLSRVRNSLARVSIESRNSVSSMDVGALDSRMTDWMNKNSRAAKQYGSTIEWLRKRLHEMHESGALTVHGLKEIDEQFKSITLSAKASGLAGKSFGDQLKRTFSNVTQYVSVASIMHEAKDILTDMAGNVISVDSAMTGLYRVTNLTNKEYKELYSTMVKSAKDYGTQLPDMITSNANWTKLGFDVNTSQKLANITSMYQHVTDLETGEAVDDLVTAYKGFQDQLLELHNNDAAAAIEYIADIYNELGNKFAVDAADLGAALQNSASALVVAGNSIEQTAGMATGMIEVTQDASRAGNALRTLSMRLRGTTAEELQAIGEDAEGLIEVTSKMEEALHAQTGVHIVDAEGNLRGTFEVMRDLAAVWSTLGENTRSNVLEMIAGKNRASDVAALLSNWESVEKAVLAANKATGSARKENEAFLNSIEGKINKFTASWQALSNTVVKSDFLAGLVDTGTGAMELLDGIVGHLGTLPTLIGAIAAALSATQNVGELSNQFQFRLYYGLNMLTKPYTNGNMNEVVRTLAA